MTYEISFIPIWSSLKCVRNKECTRLNLLQFTKDRRKGMLNVVMCSSIIVLTKESKNQQNLFSFLSQDKILWTDAYFSISPFSCADGSRQFQLICIFWDVTPRIICKVDSHWVLIIYMYQKYTLHKAKLYNSSKIILKWWFYVVGKRMLKSKAFAEADNFITLFSTQIILLYIK